MSTNPFTQEQIKLLRQNPYTYSVTSLRLNLTKEFKEIFYSQYQVGELPRQILSDHGYDPAVLGNRRVWSISAHIREQYKKYGRFHEGYTPPQSKEEPSHSCVVPVSDRDELRHLQHEVDYLKQEVEFLKKISSVKAIAKQGHCV